jgi:hypothetical protein
VFVVDVEPRFRLRGTPLNGLVLGDRWSGLLYTASDADPYTLIEDDLYLEGTLTPHDRLTLTATAEGYLQTAGLAGFGLFQAGGQLALRAVLLEGELLSTRLRYAVTGTQALQGTPPRDFRYMTGFHHEAAITQSFYPGGWRFSLAYIFTLDDVGTQVVQAFEVLGDAADLALRRTFGRAGLYEPLYFIPYSYFGNALSLDGDGMTAGQLHLLFGLRVEQRNFFHDVVIAPDPLNGYHRRRTDERLSFDVALKREIAWGLHARISLALTFNRSNVDNQATASPFDYDDKNYTRFVGTFDLLRPF